MTGVILAAGGTGGHIFPALSVAEALREASSGLRILFVGGTGPEEALAKKAGLDFAALPVAGVIGRGAAGMVALMKMGLSLVRAIGLVRSFKPGVVAGFGGYASVCPVLAAALLRLPCAVQEQNTVPGRANRILGKFADAVFTAYPDETGAFSHVKVRRTGNPVRPQIVRLAQKPVREHDGKNLLVLGGSQGARSINEMVHAAWPRLAEAGVNLWHQTGAADFERMRQGYREQAANTARVSAFIEDMTEAYDWADLVLARAGASTLAELAVAGKPALLSPYPFAAGDHQLHNACYMEKAGAAVVLAERNCSADVFAETALGLFAQRTRLAGMAKAAKREGRPHAARDIAAQLLGMVRRTGETGQ